MRSEEEKFLDQNGKQYLLRNAEPDDAADGI